MTSLERSIANLEDALSIPEPNRFERQGLVKAFEMAYELSWKTLQDFLSYIGMEGVVGPRPVIRQAFQNGLISDGEGWHAMHQARNESAHLYDESQARAIEQDIRLRFVALLQALRDVLKQHDA